MTKKDIYIEALKYGSENLIDGVNLKEFKSHMISLGYTFDGDAKEKNLQDLFNSVFGATSGGGGKSGSDTNWMEMDAYFRYVEHQELAEARSSSKRALILSILAISLSIVTALISYFQSSKPFKIDLQQLEKIEALKYDSLKLEGLVHGMNEDMKKYDLEQAEILRQLIEETKSNKVSNPTP